MPSICFEALAALWINTKKQIMREPMEQQVFTAQDNLEQCKRTMEQREKELQETVIKLAKEAISKKKAGDVTAARLKLRERERCIKRLDKLHNSLNIIETQLDAIKSSELDKEIMLSLKASTVAMKKAGISVNANEVENVMSELDDHVREMQDVTTILSNPLMSGGSGSMNSMDDEDELDSELERLMSQEDTDAALTARASSRNKAPVRPIQQKPELPAMDTITEAKEEDSNSTTQPLLELA
jgi:predicted small metal-binding protein